MAASSRRQGIVTDPWQPLPAPAVQLTQRLSVTIGRLCSAAIPAHHSHRGPLASAAGASGAAKAVVVDADRAALQ